jgi:hypothetical protein
MLQADVAGSIPDEFVGPNPSSRTMALGSTQPLTEMSNRNLPGGKGWPADVIVMWEPRRLATLLASTACYRDSSTFLFCLFNDPIGSSDFTA